MLTLVAVHFAAAAVAPLLVRRLGRNAFLLLALVPAAAAAWALTRTDVLAGGILEEGWAWAPAYGLDLTFSLELLSLLLAALVGGVGALVAVYCARYFTDREPGLGRFAGELLAFAGSMLGLVLCDNLILLYVFWELTTVFSYLLIGHYAEVGESRRAALQALMVTTLGGLALLVGLVMLGGAAGTYSMTRVLADPPSGAAVTVALVLVLVGALSKSAIFPFSLWLPAAMAAPTPVSAYLHAAAMVKAGVYLIAWLAPAFAAVGPWRPVVLTLGVVTMLTGGWRACREHDLKRLLAYGTVSQLGFLTVLVGAGTRDAALAGAMMLLAHALFKAALFLVVGVVDHKAGSRDLRELSGLGRAMPATLAVAALAAASMAGLPPLAGFVGKEAAFAAFLDGGWADTLVLAGLVAGSALTVAYSARLVWGAFATKPGLDVTHPRPAGWLFLAPAAVLSVAGLLPGPLAGWLDPTLAHYAGTLEGTGSPYHLALWHGLTLPLGLTVLVVAAGAALFAVRDRLVRLQLRLALVDAQDAYRSVIAGLERLALTLTGFTQRGSLPLYLNVSVSVLLGVVGVALVRGSTGLHVRGFLPEGGRSIGGVLEVALPGGPRWMDNWPQVGVEVLTVAAALLALRARQRLRAVLLVGVTGYGTATLFVLHGAPELGLAQILVETVTLLAFVLVLRRLPIGFTGSLPSWRRGLNALFGVLAGGMVAAVLLVATGARTDPPISREYPAAVEEAGGKNIVEIVLVDVRAWDTLGETAVLALAAAGVTSLIFLRRQTRVIPRVGDPGVSSRVWRLDGGAGGDQDGRGDGGRAADRTADRTADRAPVRAAATAEGGTTTAERDEPRAADRGAPGQAPSQASSEEATSDGGTPGGAWLRASTTLAPERRSVIFEVVARLMFHPILLLSLYLLFVGHSLPGGGFSGGIVAGTALAIRYLAGGRYELGEAAPVDAGLLLGVGLTVSAATALGGLVLGGSVLAGTVLHATVPLLGEVHLATSLFFDVGVYLVVVGVVLDILRSLGAAVDWQLEHEDRPGEWEEVTA